MPATNAGADFIANYISGLSGTPFNNTNAAIGVGDNTGAFANTQTQLEAERLAGSAIRKGMNGGYPSSDPLSEGASHKIRYSATFGTSEGNFRWEEFGIFNNTTAGAGVMLNREVDYLGEKTSAAQWVFQVDVTFSPAV